MFQVLHGSLRSAFEVAQQNDLEIVLKTIWHFTEFQGASGLQPLANRPKRSAAWFFGERFSSDSRAILKCLNVLADRGCSPADCPGVLLVLLELLLASK